jgi:hypothetical protein
MRCMFRGGMCVGGGIGDTTGAGNYYHVGRTVLTTPECPVWVEGESPGADPLSERWPLF